MSIVEDTLKITEGSDSERVREALEAVAGFALEIVASEVNQWITDCRESSGYFEDTELVDFIRSLK